MNILTLTDSKLAALHRQTANEIARRAKAATNGYDAATIVYGNEMAKRALVVAAAGNHSILFVGPPNCGKTMLRAVALELGLGMTFEAQPWPCGNRNDPRRACQCRYRQIERHLRKLPGADISVEMVNPNEREMRSPGTTLAQMRQADRGQERSPIVGPGRRQPQSSQGGGCRTCPGRRRSQPDRRRRSHDCQSRPKRTD